ncbi:O-methylsterigmatocystin oxidoreductase [Leucoagaricus sp. SymC.cos]|nr:O-methylsterigmatocystin oxidoreductase [Leucoagaricus sp. SymC.cos]
MKELLLVTISLVYLFLKKQTRNYPPGPKHLPLLSNLFYIPTHHTYLKFTQYLKDLGSDVIYLDVAGMPFIVLNSLKAYNDLLEKRSNIYLNQFHMTMGYELVDGHCFLMMQPYDTEWCEGKRLVMQHLNAPSHQIPILECITEFVRKSLLPNSLNTLEDFFNHIHNSVRKSIISLTYGLLIKQVNDPWMALAEEGLTCITSAVLPRKWVVDIFPFLKHLPEWFPGVGFQTWAKKGRELITQFFNEPFEASKKLIVILNDGSLEEMATNDPEMERLIENMGGMFIAGGADTSMTATKNLITVLLLFPKVQTKLQAKMDSVIGCDCLPDLSDKLNLPYLHATLKEYLCWCPIVPGGFPHMTMEDDEYNGYFIPKGSIVTGNTWAIFYDEEYFPEPMKFDPTQFLMPNGHLRTDKDVPDPDFDATFGFSRWKCPGMDFRLVSYWLSAASLIACFNITPEVGEMGKPIPLKFEYLGKEVVLHPEPFKCHITPCSPEVAALIQAGYDENSEYI